MSTQMFLQSPLGTACDQWGNGDSSPFSPTIAVFSGIANIDSVRLSRGSGVAAVTRDTVGSGTDRYAFFESGPGDQYWITPPIDRDVTIASTITFNLWAYESSMSANTTIGCYIARIAPNGAVSSAIADSVFTAELGTGAAAKNWTVDATDLAVHRGDRLLIVPYLFHFGTMAAGYNATFDFNGNTAAADGDSYVTFTEDFGFMEDVLTEGTEFSATTQRFFIGWSTSGNDQAAVRIKTPWVSRQLASVTVTAGKTGTPTDNLVMALQADASGVPSGTDITTVSIPAASVPVNQPLTFDLTDTALTVDTFYWLVFRRSGSESASDYYSIWKDDNTARHIWWLVGNDSGAVHSRSGQTWTPNDGDWLAPGTLTFTSAGSTLYPTTTAGGVDPNGATYDSKEAWTSRGSGVTTAIRNSADGPASPLLWTVSGGGNFVEWFTKPLQAFTLAGPVLAHIRARETTAPHTTSMTEIAVCDNDGTNPVVWAVGYYGNELNSAETETDVLVVGDDVAVTNGQRLRFRFYTHNSNNGSMQGGGTATLYYAGAAGATGDSYLTFGQTLAEYSASGDVTVNLTTKAATATGIAPAVAGASELALTTKAVSSTFYAVAVGLGVNVTLTTKACSVTFYVPTVVGTVAISTTTKAVPATFYQPVTSAEARAPPAVKSATTTFYAPGIAGGVNVALTTFAATSGFTAATIAASAAHATVTKSVTAAFPGVTVDVSTTQDANVGLTTFAASATSYAPTIFVGTGVSVSLSTKAATATANDVSVAADASIAAATQVATVSFVAPTIFTGAGTSVSLSTFAATATGYAPTIAVGTGATVSLSTKAATASFVAVTVEVGGGTAVSLSTLAVNAVVLAPTTAANSSVSIGGAGFAQPSVRATKVTQSGTGNRTMTPDASWQTGDLMIVSIVASIFEAFDPSATMQTPGGWNLLGTGITNTYWNEGNYLTDACALYTYWRYKQAGDGQATFGGSWVGTWATGIIAFAVVDPVASSFIDGIVDEQLEWLVPGITTEQVNDLLVYIAASASGSAITPPDGMTEISEVLNSPAAIAVSVQDLPGTGATGTRQASGAGNYLANAAIFAIKGEGTAAGAGAEASATAYAPTIVGNATAAPPVFGASAAFGGVTIETTSSVDVSLTTFAATATGYQPNISTAAGTNVSLQTFAATATANAATVAADSALTTSSFAATAAGYVPTTAAGAGATPSTATASTAFGGATAAANASVGPATAAVAAAAYSPTISTGDVVVPNSFGATTSFGGVTIATTSTANITLTTLAIAVDLGGVTVAVGGGVNVSPAVLAVAVSFPQISVGIFQVAVPISDIVLGQWVNELEETSNLFASLDEQDANDADYIKSVASPSNDVTELRLTPLQAPLLHTGHTLAYRYGKDTADSTIDITVSLVQTSTVIASWTHTDVATGWVTARQTLTEEQAAAITDYQDLRVRIEAN